MIRNEKYGVSEFFFQKSIFPIFKFIHGHSPLKLGNDSFMNYEISKSIGILVVCKIQSIKNFIFIIWQLKCSPSTKIKLEVFWFICACPRMLSSRSAANFSTNYTRSGKDNWMYWVIIFTWLVDLGKVNTPYQCQGHRVKVKVTGVKKNFKVKNFFFNFLCILDIFKQKKFFPTKTQNLDLENFWQIWT